MKGRGMNTKSSESTKPSGDSDSAPRHGPSTLGYIGVSSAHAIEWLDFAPGVLAAMAGESEDGSIYVKIDDTHHRLVIHPGQHESLDYVGWEYPNEAALEEAVTVAEFRGADVAWASSEVANLRHVRKLAVIDDPVVSYSHELYVGLETEVGSFDPPRLHHGFVTADRGMGHYVADTPNATKMGSFALDILQLKLTDIARSDNGAEARFFHCNRRHHSFAFVAGPTITCSALRHIMFQVDDIDDVGRALDAVEERGVEIYMTLGRHHNDRMVSFYMASPSGFAIEYGWGGVEISEGWVPVTERRSEIWGHRYTQQSDDPGRALRK
jgi:extradiol dioxygenase